MTVTYGVDLYEYNNWFADGSVEFMVLKAYEYRQDSEFGVPTVQYPNSQNRWARAKREGRKRGAYCFGHPALSPNAQADNFSKVLEQNKFNPDADSAWLDIEVTDGASPAAVATWSETFCSRVDHNLGTICGVYSYISFIKDGNLNHSGHRRLWLAAPGYVAGSIGSLFPLGPWNHWFLHQYLTTSIDWDAFHGNTAQLDATWSPIRKVDMDSISYGLNANGSTETPLQSGGAAGTPAAYSNTGVELVSQKGTTAVVNMYDAAGKVLDTQTLTLAAHAAQAYVPKVAWGASLEVKNTGVNAVRVVINRW